jgi:senescence-induced receptor-like serine/threonine-protein kinase
LTSISTEENITPIEGGDSDYFEAPNSVLQTALTPISSPNLTTVRYDNPSANFNFDGYYVVLYFAELQKLSPNQSRQFNIYLNDEIWDSDMPKYLKANCSHRYWTDGTYSYYTLAKTPTSTLPPILNAMEVYWEISMGDDHVTFSGVGKETFFYCTT